MQGDFLNAISEGGCISTDSCYVENSKFITVNGGLLLKNVHKSTEMYLLQGGNLNVTGLHGKVQATTNGGHITFQLTEVYGDSVIEARDPQSLKINISEFVQEHTCLDVIVDEITLDNTLALWSSKITGKGQLQSGDTDLKEDKLTIKSNGALILGKLSWMDTIKFKYSAKADS